MRKYLTFPVFVVALVGCASSTEIRQTLENPLTGDGRVHRYMVDTLGNTTADAPPHFVNAIKSYLEQDLRKRSMLSSEKEAPDRKVSIIVTSYRMRSGFTRQMFGIFAGKDGVDSTVDVVDARTGKVVGSSTVSSYNVMAVGEQEDVARMHAEEIARFLSGEKAK